MKKDIRLSFIRLIGILLSLGIQIVLIKFIGAKEYGVYVLFTTWSAIISQILIFGYDRVLIKELSFLYLQREKGKFRYVLNKVLLFTTINCVLFALIAICLPQKVLRNTLFSKDLLQSTWLFIAFGSVLFTGFQLIGKILISIQRVELSFIRSEVIYKLIFFFSVVLFYFFFRTAFELNIILAGAVLSYALTILFLLLFDRNRLYEYNKINKEKITFGKESYVFFFLTFNYFLINQMDKIQLGRLTNMETLGIYGLATTLCTMTSFSIVGYSRLIPKISNYINTNSMLELESEFKEVVRNAVIIALPAMVFLFVFAEDVLLFFGAKYVMAANALRILLIGQMIFYFTGPNGNLLNNSKYAKVDLFNSIVGLILTIILNFIGYKYYGIIGVASATSIGVIIVNLLKVAEVKYFLKMFPYNMENVWLTVIAFASFGLVKMLGFVFHHILLLMLLNFTTGTVIAAIVASLFYRLRGQSFIEFDNEKLVRKLRALSIKANFYTSAK